MLFYAAGVDISNAQCCTIRLIWISGSLSYCLSPCLCLCLCLIVSVSVCVCLSVSLSLFLSLSLSLSLSLLRFCMMICGFLIESVQCETLYRAEVKSFAFS